MGRKRGASMIEKISWLWKIRKRDSSSWYAESRSWSEKRFDQRTCVRKMHPFWWLFCSCGPRSSRFSCWPSLPGPRWNSSPGPIVRSSPQWCYPVSSCWRPASLCSPPPSRRISGWSWTFPCPGWKCPRLYRSPLRYWVCRKCHRLNENKITGQKDEVIVFSNSEGVYFGRADDCSWISSELCQFGLDIPEGSRNWQSAWESSMRSQDKLVLFTFVEYLNIGVGVAEFGPECQSMYW